MRLIFVEGIPGAGKTSACEYIGNRLNDGGVICSVYQEGNLYHPADYEGTAFVSKTQLVELQNEYPGLMGEELNHLQIDGIQGMVIPYVKLRAQDKISEECVQVLSRYDVYEMPPDIYKELILQKWRTFAEQLRVTGRTVVTDCCFLQNPITMLMAKYNEPPETILEFVLELEQIILEADPLLLYLAPLSVREVILEVKQSRSPQWFNHVSEYYTQQEFGKVHNLQQGIEGVVELLEKRMTLEREIQTRLSIPVISIPVNTADRNEVNRRLEDIIKEVTGKGETNH